MYGTREAHRGRAYKKIHPPRPNDQGTPYLGACPG